jgi:aryl-phospho-beta-D-glucosidase BglC (GH1 family)
LKKIFLAVALIFALSFSGPVSYYGKLKVREGRSFIDAVKGSDTTRLVQIRGVSFGWSNTGWESERFYRADAVEAMAKDWKAEVVRAAYGVASLEFSNATAVANRERVEIVIDAAIENDIYVIIDFHSHNAHNEVQQAKDFFAYMAEKYGKNDHVIFEIYNEPICSAGGNSCAAAARTSWQEIKTYAEAVIPVIRQHSDNLILVGTPEWSQRVESVIGNAIDDKNVGYVLHFYSASHSLSSWLNNINNAISNRLPIFVTEYGTTTADGGCSPTVSSGCNPDNYNSHNAARSNEWHSYMDEKKISSAAWNINDKYEGSAFFGTVQRGFDFQPASWSDTTKMTESGKYIFKKLNEYYISAPWNPDNITPILHSANLPDLEPAAFDVYSLSGKKMGNLANLSLKNGVYILVSKQNGKVQRKILKIAK